MKKIAVITTTRAEYGLLKPVVEQLRKYENEDIRIELVVSGTHLSSRFGMTVDEIDQRIDHKIEIPVNTDSDLDISKNQAEALIRFTELFIFQKYDAVVVLGDRYEMLSVSIAAGNTRTPVFHLCGGDTSEGALDEWIRHSISKISYLHFVTNEVSRKRVIQLGEDPSRVFNFGSTSIDNILTIADMEKSEALESIGLSDCDYALCTYHPVTTKDEDPKSQIDAFLDAVKSFPDLTFIVTKSNADRGGEFINRMLDDAEKTISNLHVFASLGVRRYLSLMKYSKFVLGNSSSGIIETPAFHIPTVNIGDRQRGRLQSESIINCGEDKNAIISAISEALSERHMKICRSVVSPYGDGNAASRIADKVIECVCRGQIDLKKHFYDLQ